MQATELKPTAPAREHVFPHLLKKKTTKCYNTNSYTTLLYENIGKDEVAAFVGVRAKMKFKFKYQLQCLLQLVFSYLHLGSDM